MEKSDSKVHGHETRSRARPDGALVPAGFEARVRRAPDAVALVDSGSTVSYRELDRRADRLARHLRRLGAGPETRVAVCLGRDADLVTALLGVLKAGAAYVPLDPGHPSERLAWVLEDSAAALLVTHESLVPSLRVPPGCRVVRSDAGASSIRHLTPRHPLRKHNLAYLIYTSGSTGRPKGVAVTRGALANLLGSMARRPGLAVGDVLLAVTTVSFDISALELWLPLAAGARVVLADRATATDPLRLARALEDHAVTVMQATPATWRLLVAGGWPGRPSLKILCGGEALAADLAAQLRERGAELWNLYGPTETTVWSTVHRVERPGPTVPIGEPIAATGIRLLAGELCINGAGLARGYWRQPALTAQRFVPDDRSRAAGSRLYRTGDLARRVPPGGSREVGHSNGEVEFLGRIDAQVKLRGFRIEPGEIEAALRRHPAVADAAVIARREGGAEARLLAYVVENDDGHPDERIDRWRQLWDDVYVRARPTDGQFNTAGWTSSYSGRALDDGELREWRDGTVERILALEPRRLLEIGCGSGLLLFRIASRCGEYLATDASAAALAAVRAGLDGELPQVRLARRTADDFSGHAEGVFDTVVVNSVVQYFPGVEYLLRVLRGAVGATAAGGTVFVGDVRSLPLAEAFALSVELNRAPQELPLAVLRERTRQRCRRERELLVDPAFFAALERRLPRVSRARILPRGGRARSEMNRFRYDVVLDVEKPRHKREVVWLDRLPDVRVAADVRALELLADGGLDTAGELAAAARAGGVEPEDVRDLGRQLGYSVELRLAGGGFVHDGTLAAVVYEDGRPSAPRAEVEPRPWSSYANRPARAALGPDLREHLARLLPDYMIPAAFVSLAEMPLSPAGKVDRAALARLAPHSGRPEAPRTAAQRRLAAIWAEVLGVARVGVDDDFLALGGHSLSAMQVVSRVRRDLGLELTPRSLFDHPTVAELAAAMTTAPAAGPRLTPMPRADPHSLPLSFAQQRLWFLAELEPGSPAYNVAQALDLNGELRAAPLAAALGSIAGRHEILRTTFPAVDGRPSQAVAGRGRLPLATVDLTALPAGRRSPEARRLAVTEGERPFDLGSGPLVRVHLLRLGRHRHRLLLTFHHIVSDDWSSDLFQAELAALYGAFADRAPVPLAPLPLQYADFAAWQRKWIAGEVLETQLAYWRKQLAGAPTTLRLQADRPRSAVRGRRRGVEKRILPAPLLDSARRLGHGAGASLFMTLLAAFMALLHRYTGTRDVLVGSPIAGRNRRQTEELIGFFVNTLVLRGDLRGRPGFSELLGRVRETALAAYEHQDLPFERLVEELSPARQLEHNPVFQVMFDLVRMPEPLELRGLETRRLEIESGSAEFEPSLSAWEDGGRLVTAMEFNAGLFDRTTIRRMLAHFEALLASVTARPETALPEIDLFSAAEKQQLFAEWNDTGRGPKPASFLQLFEARVARRGQAPAVIDPSAGRVLSYRELDARANRLARRLREDGVLPETRVGVMMARSVDAVVAFVGVLKAGGAFVPLDPEYPRQRLDLMIEDACVEVLLSGKSPLIPPSQRGEPQGAALALPHPESSAYVIYTSGSTGRPKGVVIAHRALGWYCVACGEHYGLTPADRILQFASLSFDISIGEIFPCLAAGATLVLRDDEMAGSLEVFLQRCRDWRTSVLLPPTAFWHELAAEVAARPRALPPALRLVSFGGEAVAGERVADWQRAAGGRVRLVNGYGPTETTVEAALQPLDEGVAHGREARIGRPVEGVRLLVVDRGLRPVPVGVPGELAIASRGLARGYFRRGGATAASFVPHPRARRPGERVYRTGDLARFLADGTLELLGRADRQVKVRGFRVEPGEIEDALTRHPAVREAAVVVHRKRLTAWVTGAAEDELGALADDLRRTLPEHMVPAVIAAVDSLPLSAAGKVDRDALARRRPGRLLAPERDLVAPRNAAEEKLTEIWRQVLADDEIGIHDNFFELGGHSLNATRVISRVRRVFRCDLPLRRLFEEPTIAGLAAGLGAALTAGGGPVPHGLDRARPQLSFAQRRLWFLERLEGGNNAYHMPDAFRVQGRLDPAALATALGEIARRHEVLRAVFGEAGGRARQVIRKPGGVALPVVDLRGLPGGERWAEARRLVREEADRPFDLRRGPVLRAALIRLTRGDQVFLRTLHHIVSDGWSDGVFYRELAALYAAAAEGRPSPLPELTLQYADFAVWQRRRLSGLERETAYWRQALADELPRLELPADRPRPREPVRRHGALATRTLPAELAERLERLARVSGATVFMALLAAFAALLERLTGDDVVVVGTPVAGRTHEETEGLIGLFVNSLALRVDLSGEGLTFHRLLERVRDVVLGALAHQELPFDRVVEALSPERRPGTNPLFQTMFDQTGESAPLLELAGCETTSVATEEFTPLFEAALTVRRSDGSLRAGCEYDAALFDATTVARWLRHFETLLADGVAEPDRTVRDLAAWSAVERQQAVALSRDGRTLARPGRHGGLPLRDGERRVRELLRRIWSRVLEVEDVGLDDDFFALGGDSILSLRVIAQAREAGLRLTPRDLFRHQTIGELARRAESTPVETAPPMPAIGPVPLTPIQHEFFAWALDEPWHYNQSLALELVRDLDPGLLAATVARLLRHHDALRLRFAGGEQSCAEFDGRVPVTRLDLSRVDAPWIAVTLQIQASLDLASGPLARFVHVVLGDGRGVLLIVVHHLAVDAVSWPILLEDFERLYMAANEGLPDKTTSFREWAERLTGEARSPATRREMAYWTRPVGQFSALPVDAAGANSLASETTLTVTLDAERTHQLLREVPAVYRTRIDELLLTALARAFARWTGSPRLLVTLEGHGRENLFADVDLSRTVGWFTSAYPVVLDLEGAHGDGAALKAIKEQLRRVPRRGIGWGLLRYLDGRLERPLGGIEGGGLPETPRPEVSFNYLGPLDPSPAGSRLFAGRRDPGPEQGRGGHRELLFEIDGGVAAGRLAFEWAYSRNRHRHETVEALAADFREELERLVDHCLSPQAGGATPADFPLAGLDQQQLDRLLGAARHAEDLYPLSPLQEGMLFHALYAPQSSVYFEQLAWDLPADADPDLLRQAWQRVLDRHGALRVSFAWEGLERPLQIVHRRLEVPWEERDSPLDAVLVNDRRRGFDLARAPLMRLVLVRRGTRCSLVWSAHHLLLDGWSTPRVLAEVTAIYEALRCGGEAELETPPPFRDFIAWLEDQDLESAERFWRRTLKGFDSPTPLPGTRRAPPSDEPPGNADLHLTEDATRTLDAFARRHRLTLNTLVQATWALLLMRSSGRRDVVFGITVAGRPASLPGSESIVGLLVNTLPLRVRLAPDDQLVPWLRNLQEHNLEIRRFEHSPLADVQAWSEIPRPRPLFESLLAFENYPALDQQADGDARGFSKTNYPLTLLAVPERRLALHLQYERRRCGGVAARQLLRQLETALAGLTAADRPGDVEVLTRAHQHQLLIEWNETHRYPAAGGLHRLFEAQAGRRPEAIAVCGPGDACLSYGELDRRADRAARRLRGLGVGPERLVGLSMERSVDMVTGLLAILKAGGAYVPLDPDYPPERLQLLLEDSGVEVVVTTSWLRDQDAQPETISESEAGGENLAYVIHTSGSSGRPKGVGVSHANVLRLLAAADEKFRFRADDVWTLFHSVAFDFSVWELWGALAHGGRLVVVPYLVSRSPEEFCDLLDRHKVTVLSQTPSAFSMLPPNRRATALRWVVFGGEALDPGRLRPWLERHGDDAPRLVNMYGITETTVHVTWRRISRRDVRQAAGSPIGRQLGHLQLHVLDDALALVPPAAAGELHVGGEGLARGYLNRPGLTAERFLPSPFGHRPGRRLYKTGDRARLRLDGDLEYLGRTDRQVKIRGFRIEPGEIEHLLVSSEAVREAAVVARDGRLLAYVTPQSASERELRELLRTRLPEHMMPSAFVPLAILPLTAHGKVDRAALGRHALAERAPPADCRRRWTAPRTSAEKILAGIWRRVLGRRAIGRDDNFFELGGHSLDAVRVISRVREVFRREVPLRRLFEDPTVKRLAAELGRAEDRLPPPLRPTARRERERLSFAQQRLWFLDRSESAYVIADAFRLRGPLDRAALETAWRLLLDRHEILRARFPSRDGEPFLAIGTPPDPALPAVDLQALPPKSRQAEARRLAGAETGRRFDLASDPPARLTLVRLGAGEHLLLRTVHHIVTDGWSDGVFYRELSTLYARGEAAALPRLPIRYADYAAWQRRRAGEEQDSLLGYWKKQLAGLPTTRLPADRPWTESGPHRAASHVCRLRTAGLAELSRGADVTLFMTLLAAFTALLQRLTGAEDLVLGTAIANRPHRQTEGLVGFFVNTLVLRADLGGDPSVRDLLQRTRALALDAYAHQDLPFEKLVEALAPPRRPGENPLFQIMFQLDNEPRGNVLELRGLESERIEPAGGRALFKLTLEAWEEAGGLAVSLDYDTDLYDATTIRRTAGYLRNLLSGFAVTQRRLSELALLGEAEEHQMTAEWSSAPALPPTSLFPELFAAQIAKAPSATALVDLATGEELTYGELARQARRMARRLAGRGVGPEVRVGVLLPRGAGLVVTLLGILEAGGAYVPLDPDYPRQRLDLMIEDAGIEVLVTEDGLDENAAARKSPLAPQPGAPLSRRGEQESLQPANAAYVIYTSGSTGIPKGVVVDHRALASFTMNASAYCALDPSDRVLQFASASFDLSVAEIFPTLTSGATLVLRDSAMASPAELLRRCGEQAITVLLLPTTVWHELADTIARASVPPSLRLVFFGGEPVSPRRLAAWRRAVGSSIRLLNAYGPTETTVDATFVELEPGSGSPRPGHETIGRPVANMRVRVLDRTLRRLPVRAAGELCLAGPVTARGYLGRPADTAERFVPDPGSGLSGERLFRSGDAARWRADGQLELLGRLDRQLKIRGFRVEPGEIEDSLSRHPAVREAAVVARDSTAQLVAFVAADAESDELRRWLAEKLPAFMVPGHFVPRESLPRTPAGKLDRIVLSRQAQSLEPQPSRPVYAAPRNATEEDLVGIWADLLDLDGRRIGVRDDFFALGGHSLLAVRLMARIEQRFDRQLHVADVLRYPTVEGLAAKLLDGRQDRPSILVPIRPGHGRPGRGRPLFLVHPVGGHVFCYKELTRHLGSDRPVYGLQSQGYDGREPFLDDLPAMAGRYLDAVRTVQPHGPYLLGGWSMGGWIAFEMARRLRHLGQEVGFLALIDPAAPDNGKLVPAQVSGTQSLDGAFGQERIERLHRHNELAMGRYRPRFFAGEITLFLAKDRDAGRWRSVAGEVDCRTVAGDHFSMMREPHVRRLARELEGCLEERPAPRGEVPDPAFNRQPAQPGTESAG